MYSKVDYSGYRRMKIASAISYLILMSIFFLVSLFDPLAFSFEGVTVYVRGTAMPISILFITYTPIASFLLGTFFGVLTKRCIRIFPDGASFNDETRNLAESDSEYHEGSETSKDLAGNPASYRAWTSFIVVSLIIALPLNIIPPLLIGLSLTISCGFLYPIGYYLIKKAEPIQENRNTLAICYFPNLTYFPS